MNKDQFAYLNIRIKELEAELEALKTPPKCPICKSTMVDTLFVFTANSIDPDHWFIKCNSCDNLQTGPTHRSFFETIDSALNSWRTK